MPLFKKSDEPEQRKKIYSEEEIKRKLESMNPDMQNTFIRMAESLLHKESQMFLDIVAQSRQDIMDVGQSIKDEQDVLKSTAKFLARERTGEGGLDCADDEEDKTRIHFETEHSKKAVQDYLRAVGRDAPDRSGDVQKRRIHRLKAAATFIPDYARKVGTVSPEHSKRPMTAASISSSRPGTAYRMRMQKAGEDEGLEMGAVGGARPASGARSVQEVAEATPAVDEKVKVEKEELMEHMKRMDSAMQGERERQQEAIKARKEARKAKKEAKKAEEQTQAQELLDSNLEAEEQKKKSKERQEQILKERLAKKKLERRKTLQDIETEDPNDASAEPELNRSKTSVEPQAAEEPDSKDTKKKKKKKKEDAVPAPVEADWGAGEEPKKSKKKKKAADAAEGQPPAEEAAGEKKKKKKKKADAPAPDTVLDLEEPAAEEKKKKKKKKNLEELDMSVSEV